MIRPALPRWLGQGTGWRGRSRAAAFVVVATLAGSLGVFLAAGRSVGGGVYAWSSGHVFRHTRIIVGNETPGRTIRALVIDGPGGPARIEWTDGHIAPLHPRTGMYVGLYLDGRLVASSLFGGRSGRFEGGPGGLKWLGRLRAGRHVIQVRVDRSDTGFAVPRASPTRPVMDLLRVTEYA